MSSNPIRGALICAGVRRFGDTFLDATLSKTLEGTLASSTGNLRALSGPLDDDFRLFPELLGPEQNSFSLERCSKIVTFAFSAQATSSELQNPSKRVSETLSELPTTLPRAPREVPGASRRPLRSGPRRFQRHLRSARGLRSTSEAALKAFRASFRTKLRASSLLFFVLSCPWPLLSGLVWSAFCCFCSTLLRFCAPQFSWPFVAMEVQLLLLF